MRVVISRHERKLTVHDGEMLYGIGDHVDNVQLELEACPRGGELLTVHPTGEPSEESWTVQITGVQHVAGLVESDPEAGDLWRSAVIAIAVAM